MGETPKRAGKGEAVTKEQLHVLTPLPEREANRDAYGQPFGDMLTELLGLVTHQQRNWLTDYEIQAFAKAIFEDYISRYFPEIAKQAARYVEQRQAEQHRLQVQMSENEHHRQERLREEQAAGEKAAADAEGARYSKARVDEARSQEELSKIRAQEQRELQERML
jgi:hypothetical protein